MSAKLEPRAKIALKVAASVVAGILVLSVLSNHDKKDKRRYSPKFVKEVNRAVQQANQWMSQAKQDTQPLFALMHINYAIATANALRRQVSSEEIKRMTGVDIEELIYLWESEQREAIQKIGALCPVLQPSTAYAIHTGWVA